jgi:23S rRNA (cytidine1920-2'-O)/16S rRNA (cytidine1409-2'-O)-methyltransferase
LGSGISFVSMDVSFISATLVLPGVLAAVREGGESRVEAVILVKPQFEAGREHIGKGGIVSDPAAHQLAIDRVRAAVHDLGAAGSEVAESPIQGAKGNREFLLYSRF